MVNMEDKWLKITETAEGKVLSGCSEEAYGDIVIPDGVTIIGEYAFDVSKIESITMPDSVTEIKDYAFFECNNLKEVRLSNNLKTIGMGAFSWCTSLERITIPDGTVSISDDVFCACEKLSYVYIPASVRSIGIFLGNKTYHECFWGCKSLKELHVLNDRALLRLLDKHFPATFRHADVAECVLYTHSYERVEDFPPSRRRFAKRFKAIKKEPK